MGQRASDLLREEFTRRKRRNQSYSLRSFARDLKVNAGTLSSYLNDKRPLSEKKLEDLAKRLAWSPEEKNRISRDSKTPETLLSEQNHFHIIAEWEHYAIFTLLECHDFQCDPSWIAGRLGLTQCEVVTALNRLERAGLISVSKEGAITKPANSKLCTTDGVVSAALKKAHEENLEIAQEKLEQIDLELRDYSSVTFTGSLEQIQELKNLIRKFRKKVFKVAASQRKEQVFQLSIQLYPLTQVSSRGEKTT